MKGLTAKQKNIVEFIEEFSGTMEMAPTIYEIAEHFGIKTSTVFAHIRALQKKNILQRSSKARSISLTKSGRRSKVPAGACSVPVVESSDASLNAKGSGKSLICDSKLFSSTIGGKDLFAVHVRGHELGMGFLDGDMLLIKPSSGSISEGDLLLMMENGKPAVRSCEKNEDGMLRLISGEPGRQSVSIRQNDLPLKGVIVGLQRSL